MQIVVGFLHARQHSIAIAIQTQFCLIREPKIAPEYPNATISTILCMRTNAMYLFSCACFISERLNTKIECIFSQFAILITHRHIMHISSVRFTRPPAVYGVQCVVDWGISNAFFSKSKKKKQNKIKRLNQFHCTPNHHRQPQYAPHTECGARNVTMNVTYNVQLAQMCLWNYSSLLFSHIQK